MSRPLKPSALTVPASTAPTPSSKDGKYSKQDVNEEPVIISSQSNMSGVRAAMRASSRKLAPVRTKLAYQVSNTSGANAALTTVIPIEPATSSEFASWASLYDEVIVHGGMFHFDGGASAGPTAGGGQISAALAYDPVNSGAYGSVAAVLEASQCKLFKVASLNNEGAFGPDGATMPVTGDGYQHFRFTVPKGKPARNTATTTNVSSEYSATSDSADTYGWIKPYIPAQGGTTTSLLWGFVVLDVTFRSRS